VTQVKINLKTKGKTPLIATILTTLIVLSMLTIPTYASSPTFAVDVTPLKSAYYINEDVQVKFELEWQYLTQNYTVNMELWNSTDKLSNLATGYEVAGATTANGTYTTTYTISDLTEEIGSATYYVKVVESGTGLAIAQDSFSITVQSKSIALSVAWDDANKDRTIDVAESVTFNIYLTWAFVNETKTATLYVTDNGIEQVIDTIEISAGSGSATKTYVTSYDSAGTKTVSFKVEDSEGTVLAQKTASVTVGGIATTVTEKSASFVDDLSNFVRNNLMLLIVFMAIVVVAFLIYNRK